MYNYLSSVHCINLFEYELKILKYKKKELEMTILCKIIKTIAFGLKKKKKKKKKNRHRHVVNTFIFFIRIIDKIISSYVDHRNLNKRLAD